MSRSASARLPTRTLIGEILLSQLGFALIVGAIAIASLWSSANWIARETMAEMAERWIDDLDSLGVGLYSGTGKERYLRIEGYVAKFPEISYVRYYDPDGRVIFTDANNDAVPALPSLNIEQLDYLRRKRHAAGHTLLEPEADMTLTRIGAAIVVGSIDSNDLLTAATLDELSTHDEVVGFVELGLDYKLYDEQLWRHTKQASATLAVAFLILALLGRAMLRRALRPLSDIQDPLARLADGETDLVIADSPHREIAAIGDGLRNAALRIEERDAHLRYLANHDTLTGLPNRYAFTQAVRDLLASGSGAVLFVDLDQFKYVNDTLGHKAGDTLLKQVAARMQFCVGDKGVIARFGGDEFGVVLAGASAEQSQLVAKELLSTLVELPFVQGNQSMNLTCSVGVAQIDHSMNVSVDDVMAYADLACQKAKTDGRNRVRVYAPDAGTIDALKHEIGWSQKLKAALKNDHFLLVYQPIADIRRGTVTHFEVLLRLNDEDGLHNPDAFLAAAERFSLMNDIDQWVIEHAFRSLAWHRRQKKELRFTINLSGGAFLEGGLVPFIEHHLKVNKLDPSAVIFEITEQVAVDNFADANSQIRKLMALGCEFALDDFGTGYSSFTYLKELPVQYVKIDGRFIKDLHNNKTDQAMVRAIADVAGTLGKKTVAEFVSEKAILHCLAEFGIDYAQGFFVGKPAAKIDLDCTLPKLRKPRVVKS